MPVKPSPLRALRRLIPALLCASLASPALADTTCGFGAFVAGTDPTGLNVREAPSTRSKILGKLPPPFIQSSMNHYAVRVEVDVLGARDGWFRIRNASDNTTLTEHAPRPMFTGEGWVSGTQLTVKSQADVGRARPDPASPERLRFGDDETFDNDLMVDAGRLVDCNGAWALVEFADARIPTRHRADFKVAPAARTGLPRGRFRVWLDRLCGIQETSCDGLALPEPAAPPAR